MHGLNGIVCMGVVCMHFQLESSGNYRKYKTLDVIGFVHTVYIMVHTRLGMGALVYTSSWNIPAYTCIYRYIPVYNCIYIYIPVYTWYIPKHPFLSRVSR
jgi:hypothetical protein